MKNHQKAILIKGLLLTAVFFFYLLPPLDTDLGWQLRYGQHILTTGTVWRANQLGFLLPNYHWHHCYSGYQLLVFFIFKYFSFWGLAVASGVLMSAVLFWIIKGQNNPLAWLLTTVFFIIISLPVTQLGIRSQLFTLLGIAFLFHFLNQKQKLARKHFLTIPLLFTAWANLHGGFILGIILLSFFGFEKIVRRQTKEGLKTFLLILLSFGGSLINPFGIKIYPEIIRHSYYPLNKLIAEWVPPNHLGLLLIFTTIVITAMGLIIQIKNKKTKWLKTPRAIFLVLSYFFFLYLAFSARRNLPLLAISFIYLASRLFPLKPLSGQKVKIIKTAICLILIGTISWKLIHLPALKQNWQSQIFKKRFPYQAVQYLRQRPSLCSRIFNAYEWGGYLAWQLPNKKVFVDGRMPAWPTPEGKSPYAIYLEIIQARKDFEKKLAYYQADCLFISPGTFLDLELKNNPHPWKQVYKDKTTVIYQKQK